MRISNLLFFVFCVFYSSCDTGEIPIYIGTYTDGESEGIYRMNFDQNSGLLSSGMLVAKVENPSFLTFSPDRKYLYTVKETSAYKGSKNGAVVSFEVLNDGKLEFLSEVSSEGAHPCHITLDETGTCVAVSNYTGGTAALFQSESGILSSAFQVMDHNGDSIKSHVHSALFKDDKLYVADLGRNAVYGYKKKGVTYDIMSSSLFPSTTNAGPRHFVLTADGTFIYVINEYANTVSVAIKKNGSYELIDSKSTLDDEFTSESFCADIHLSKDERFIYGSNRGENTIVVFQRNSESGEIQRIQNISVEGNWPRNFTLSPNGKFLLVANQKSNNISTFSVDTDTGKLAFVGNVDFPSPVCLLF